MQFPLCHIHDVWSKKMTYMMCAENHKQKQWQNTRMEQKRMTVAKLLEIHGPKTQKLQEWPNKQDWFKSGQNEQPWWLRKNHAWLAPANIALGLATAPAIAIANFACVFTIAMWSAWSNGMNYVWIPGGTRLSPDWMRMGKICQHCWTNYELCQNDRQTTGMAWICLFELPSQDLWLKDNWWF